MSAVETLALVKHAAYISGLAAGRSAGVPTVG
jgi:hypothetical protein